MSCQKFFDDDEMKDKISFSAEKDYMCKALTPLLINIERSECKCPKD